MKILVLTPLYYIKERPELFHDTNAVHYLVKYWVKMGHEVQVIVTYVNYRRQIIRYKDKNQRKYWKEGYEYQVDGVNVYLIEEQLIFNKDWFVLNNEIHIAYKIRKYLKKRVFIPDVIVNHFPCYASGYIKRLKFANPCIAVLHQTDVKKGKQDSRFLKRLNNNYCAVYARSQGILHEAEQWGLQNLEADIIYSGAPDSKIVFEKESFKKNSMITVLYVGKLIPRKNVDLLIAAVAEFCNLQLEIIGNGEQREELEKLTEELQITNRVRFLGEKSRMEVMAAMEKAMIFCMPSIKETFGLVYLEAMRQGCITIGTFGEGISGVIQNGRNGFLCTPTKEGIREVLIKILELSEIDLEGIAREAVKTGILFSEENVSKKYLSLIKGWCEHEN